MGDKYYHNELEPPVGRLVLDDTEDDLSYQDGIEIDEEDLYQLRNNTTTNAYPTPPPNLHTYHPWGIFFTIIGTVLLDFDADACQSPSRAYLLDVTLPGIRILMN